MNIKLYYFFILFFVFGVLGDDFNRCGYIPDNRSVYTNFFDSSNGHNVLDIKITTNNVSGYTWENVVSDRDKWDEYSPWVFCSVSIGGAPAVWCEAERRGDWSRESPLGYKVRNKLSYELLQNISNMGSLFTQFAIVTVNGHFYGIYTLIEDLDEHMMKTHGLNKKSNLYNANYVFWSLKKDYKVKDVNDTKYNKSKFEEIDIEGIKNHTLLIKMYNDIYDPNVDSRSAILNNFNANNVATWIAFIYLTANTDLIFNNFGLYAPAETKNCSWPTPFYFYSWDNDGAWDDHYFDKSIPGVDFPYHEEGVQYFWSLRVVKRFLMVDEFVDLLKIKMLELASGPLSNSTIAPLVAKYTTILEPYLSTSPDKENIAWNASIRSWKKAIDLLPKIPAEQYRRFNETSFRPMPVDMKMMYNNDRSSLFFFWDKSYILYNKPLYYEFNLATTRSFSTTVVKITTNTTYVTIAASQLSPSTKYYWRVIVRNTQSPKHFIDTYPSLSDDDGFGITFFTSPSSISPLVSAPAAHNITHKCEISEDNRIIQYASLDNLDPSLTRSPCSNTALPLPSGWTFAPNSVKTRQNIRSVGLPWGGSKLVLADGALFDPLSGKLLDGFGDFSQHLIETIRAGNIKTYSANCSTSANNRVLLIKL